MDKYNSEVSVCKSTPTETQTGRKPNSNAVTRRLKKPHGMASQLVYRAENHCKPSGAPAWAVPRPPRPGWAGKRPINRLFQVPPHQTPERKLKTSLTALEQIRTIGERRKYHWADLGTSCHNGPNRSKSPGPRRLRRILAATQPCKGPSAS